MYLIDTNIFLEILLGQKRAGVCLQFFKDLEYKKERLYVSDFTIHSIAVIMEHHRLLSELLQFFKTIESSPNISIYHASLSEEREATEHALKSKLDFDDSLHFIITIKLGATLVSYDRHFSNLPNLKILRP